MSVRTRPKRCRLRNALLSLLLPSISGARFANVCAHSRAAAFCSSCAGHGLVRKAQFDASRSAGDTLRLDAQLKCPTITKLAHEQPVEPAVRYERYRRERRQQKSVVSHDQEVALQRHRQANSCCRTGNLPPTTGFRHLGDRLEDRSVLRL